MRFGLPEVVAAAAVAQGVRLYLKKSRPRDIFGLPDRYFAAIPVAVSLIWIGFFVTLAFETGLMVLVGLLLVVLGVGVGLLLSLTGRPAVLLPRWTRAGAPGRARP